MMSFYGIIVFIHIIAAVCGLGATFALPVLMSRPKTVSHALFAFTVNTGIEKLAKIGSLTLLATGLALGALNPGLFSQIWYIASIIIYIAVQPVVAVMLPRKLAEQKQILENHKGDELPESYHLINKKMAPYNNFTYAAAVVLIALMVLKPF